MKNRSFSAKVMQIQIQLLLLLILLYYTNVFLTGVKAEKHLLWCISMRGVSQTDGGLLVTDKLQHVKPQVHKT